MGEASRVNNNKTWVLSGQEGFVKVFLHSVHLWTDWRRQGKGFYLNLSFQRGVHVCLHACHVCWCQNMMVWFEHLQSDSKLFHWDNTQCQVHAKIYPGRYLILGEKIKTKTHKNKSCNRYIRKFNQHYKIKKIISNRHQRSMPHHLNSSFNSNDSIS